MNQTVILFDRDLRRRVALSRDLSTIWHVEPFDDVEELSRFVPRNSAFALVDDNGEDVRAVMRALTSSEHELPVVAYSDAIDATAVVDRLHEGAADYLALPFDYETIARRIETSVARQVNVLRQRRRSARARELIEALSPRESEVVRSVAAGNSNKGIALELGISPRTVEIHRANMLKKLEVGSVAEATRLVIEAGVAS
jgi:FixJ family two-component response regulator